MGLRSAAKAGARHISGPLICSNRLGNAHGFGRRGRNVDDAAMRRRSPLPAVEIHFPCGVIIVVGLGIEGPKRGVVIARAWNMILIRKVTLGGDTLRLGRQGGARRQCARGKTAQEYSRDRLAAFHESNIYPAPGIIAVKGAEVLRVSVAGVTTSKRDGSTEHCCCDYDANPEYHRGGDDRRGNILVLDDLVVEITRCAFVE